MFPKKDKIRRFATTFIYQYLFIFLLNVNAIGSNPIDSLKTLIRENTGNPEKLSVLYARLSKKMRDQHNDSCYQAAITGLTIALKAGYDEGILKNSLQLGRYLITIDSLNLAFKHLLTAKSKIKDNSDPEDKMAILITMGYISDLQSRYSDALEYYLEGLRVAELNDRKDWRQFFNNNIAIVYNSAHQYEKSIRYYREVLAYFGQHGDSSDFANTLVNIGVSYLNLSRPDSAKSYFNRALPVQIRHKNHYGMAILYIAYGSLYNSQKNYHESLLYFEKADTILESLPEEYIGSVQHLRVNLITEQGKAYLGLKQYRQAENLFRSALEQTSASSLLLFETEALLGLSQVFETSGKNDSAVKYTRLYIRISDSLEKVKDMQRLGVLETEYRFLREKERLAQEKKIEEERKKSRELTFILIIIGILGFSGLLFMFLMLQRNKARRLVLEQTNLRLEKDNLKMDIELRNKELTIKSMSLAEKDELLTDVTKQLKGIVDTEHEEGDIRLRMLVNELQRKDTKNFWDEFNTHFKEVHVDFYSRLSADFPQITPNELKLCAFLKLNLSTKQISQITRKSEHSIKVARYRLRQKLGLEREENLSIFLSRY